MSSFKVAIMTDAGAKLMADSIIEGYKIEFVKMVIGSGEYEEEEKTAEALRIRTELKQKRQEVGFSSRLISDENEVLLKTLITNKELDVGYRMREIGIIAKKAGDVEEVLYSIAIAKEADYLPPKDNPVEIIQEYYTKVSNAENIVINVEMEAYALAEDMQKVLHPEYDEAEELSELESGRSIFKEFGKLKKAVSDLIGHIRDKVIHITSTERTNWNDANTKKHTHSNKGVLDKITQALLDSLNTAYTHISDTIKHITAAERTLWNTVSNKVDKVSGKGLSTNDYTTAEKNKLAGIATNANNYAHPTTAGNKHIPSGGSSGQILRWSADGTAVWGSDNNTTYSTATQLANGLMSSTDKKKLDGIATNANNYTHPTTAGNKHIPSGGSSGQILRWSADGTAVWGSDNNTTYSNMTAATASAAGKAGLVPAPAAGKQASFLRGDGTWATPTDTNTWRGITDSLTSTSTTTSLSAKAGKSLKDSIDIINNNLKQNTTGKFILPNGLKICWGKSKPPNTNGYIRSTVVNFPVTFNAVPVVCVTKLVSNSYTECGVTSAVGTITEKQFNIKAMYQETSLSDLEVELQWIAIGY